ISISPVPTSAYLAVSVVTLRITKSPAKAIPIPNKLIATAAPMAGNPILMATGKSTTTTNAVVGVGQKKVAAIYGIIPKTKKAAVGLIINFFTGATISLSAP